jgi:hypothetical protein
MFVRKVMALGTLPEAADAVYTAPADVTGLIHNVTLHNKSVNAQTVTLQYHSGSVDYQMYRLQIPAADTVSLGFYNEGFVVMTGCSLRGYATEAGAVNVKVDGTEES